MDGYEACLLIDEFLRENYPVNKKRPFIYTLTADSSPATKQKIASYPFKDHFESL